MAGQGEMFQELEEKRREDGFFPKLHKAGQPNGLFFSQSKNYVIKTLADLFMNFFSYIQPPFPRRSVLVGSLFIAVNLHLVYKVLYNNFIFNLNISKPDIEDILPYTP
jgi:hypothetical protein